MNHILKTSSLPHKSRGKVLYTTLVGSHLGMLLLLLYPMNTDSYVICGSIFTSQFLSFLFPWHGIPL